MNRRYPHLALAISLLLAATAGAQTPQPAAARTVHLFSVGDWGLDSPDRQTVANAIAARSFA